MIAESALQTSGDHGLEAVCRSALGALGARRITVWRCSDDRRSVSPYVSVGASPTGVVDADEAGLAEWRQTPIGDLPSFAAVLDGCHGVVIGDAADLGGPLGPAAVGTGTSSAICEPLYGHPPPGLVVIEPSEAGASSAVVDVLCAAVSSWICSRPAYGWPSDHTVVSELAAAGKTLDPFELLRLACRRLAQVLGARRASIFAAYEPGHVRLRLSERADGSPDDEVWERMCATVEPPLPVARVLAGGRPEAVGSAELIGSPWAEAFDVAAALAVPLGEVAVLFVDDDRPVTFGTEQLELAMAAADQLRDAANTVRRRREQDEHVATAGALRQLLEAGLQACSSMEAAGAIAAAAACVLGLPTACAYLVDGAGRISEVATVGAGPGLAETLTATLVGKLAVDSPVWRRTVEGINAGSDFIADTTVAGVVRPGGVAEVLQLRSLATIPLLSSDGPVGLILCGDTNRRRHWRDGDREVLEQLALEGAIIVDNARLREAERHEASHDPLTGLLNRRAFSDEFRRALEVAGAEGGSLAVLVVDLDRFKEVNDDHGHHSGDELLVEIGRRLRAALREQDILARMGGDEFAAVLTGDGRNVDAVVGRIKAALAAPLELGARTVCVDASIGAAVFPDQGDDIDSLLQRADLAMYVAKRSARRGVVHRVGSRSRPRTELGLLGDLRRALDRGDEMVLYYQPKLDVRSDRVVGVEALIRWDHPRYGILGADTFVPLAAEAGLMGDLTTWVVPTALGQVARWRDGGVALRMSVNVAAGDVADAQLGGRFDDWLRTAGVPGTSLVVEVTESALLRNGAQTQAGLQDLRSLGIEVSLDDFGTGYSSLAYLESLPVDEIKIDRRFLSNPAGQRRVLRSIIDLGHDLGIRVLAEGVETAEHLAWLQEAGCDEAQGYLFSRPLAAEALPLWLATRSQAGTASPRRRGSSRSLNHSVHTPGGIGRAR